MNWTDHDHRGDYADVGHDHYDHAERHHRHYDTESEVAGLREDLGRAVERIRELEDRCAALERQTPAARQAQYEADVAAADLEESGYDRHGADCQCSHCYVPEPCGRCGSVDPDICGCFDNDDAEPEEYDPGPAVDDEGGMSEYRYAINPAES